MAYMFHRRLAIPLWAMACFTVAFTVPPTATLLMSPTTVFAIVALGITAIVVLVTDPFPRLPTPRALVRVLSSTHHRDQASAAITMAAPSRGRTLDRPNRNTADDVLDLDRMDDDGGRQTARPPE